MSGTSVETLRRAVDAFDGRIDAIVADYRLGAEETGLDAIEVLRAAGLSCPALLISGDESAPPTGPEALPMLRKPVMPFQLRAALSALLR